MKKGILLIAVVCISSFASFAQKLGHISGQELVEHMPEYKVALEELKAYEQQLSQAMGAMEEEYRKMIEAYQKEQATAPQVVLEQKERDIMRKQEDMQNFEKTVTDDLNNAQVTKMEPILKKAKETIEQVAKDNGYTYIFDSSTGTLLYLGGDDITSLVCAKMNIPDYSKEVKAPETAPKK